MLHSRLEMYSLQAVLYNNIQFFFRFIALNVAHCTCVCILCFIFQERTIVLWTPSFRNIYKWAFPCLLRIFSKWSQSARLSSGGSLIVFGQCPNAEDINEYGSSLTIQCTNHSLHKDLHE